MNAVVQPLDLSSPAAWRDNAPNVLMSVDGRYTIVRYLAVGELPETFTAFRRHGPPEQIRWSPPDIVGGGREIVEAFQACILHSLEEVQR